MARIRQTVKIHTPKLDPGTHPCPYCNGTGRKKNVGRGSKK